MMVFLGIEVIQRY